MLLAERGKENYFIVAGNLDGSCLFYTLPLVRKAGETVTGILGEVFGIIPE